MKLWVLLVLCILASLYVLAEDITLGIGESYVREGVNITFAKMNNNKDKVILCVNNIKEMLGEDELEYFRESGNGSLIAQLEVNHIDAKDKTIDIDVGAINGCGIDCKCTGNCLNPSCEIEKYDEWGNPIKIGNATIEENKTNINEEAIIKENKTEGNKETNASEEQKYALVTSSAILGSLIGVGIVWLCWFRNVPF